MAGVKQVTPAPERKATKSGPEALNSQLTPLATTFCSQTPIYHSIKWRSQIQKTLFGRIANDGWMHEA